MFEIIISPALILTPPISKSSVTMKLVLMGTGGSILKDSYRQYLRYSSFIRSRLSIVSSSASYSRVAVLSLKDLKFIERHSLIFFSTYGFWIMKQMVFAIVVAWVRVPARKKVSDSLIIWSSLFSKRGSWSIMDSKSPLCLNLGSYFIASLRSLIIFLIRLLS